MCIKKGGKEMMTKREALNQHVRFDERNDASAATSRRDFFLY